MSRSGYSDGLDQQELAMWRGRVASAMRGKRGQALLRELRDTLDAMPEKRLIAGKFATSDGEVCLLGAAGKRRNLPDLVEIDSTDHDWLADQFNVAACLIQEIEFINDEGNYCSERPEQRFVRVRKWLDENIADGEAKVQS